MVRVGAAGGVMVPAVSGGAGGRCCANRFAVKRKENKGSVSALKFID